MRIKVDIKVDTEVLKTLNIKEEVRDSNLFVVLSSKINNHVLKECVEQLTVLSAEQSLSYRQVDCEVVIDISDEKLIKILNNEKEN